jgi:hypothetical protein
MWRGRNRKIKFQHFPNVLFKFSNKKCLKVCETCECKNVVECWMYGVNSWPSTQLLPARPNWSTCLPSRLQTNIFAQVYSETLRNKQLICYTTICEGSKHGAKIFSHRSLAKLGETKQLLCYNIFLHEVSKHGAKIKVSI